jgi:hypothetical protein
MKAYVVAFCGILLTTSALAEPAGTAGGSSAEPSTPTATPESANHGSDRAQDGQRQICRRIEADTSSRLGSRRACHTAEEWRALQNGS